MLKRFLKDRRGATALEYALLVTFLSIVVASAVTALGTQLYAVIGTAATAAY
jgi:Flp pilus assembly pilin Flp